VPDYITVAHLGNDAVSEDKSVGMPDYITITSLGNDAVCEYGGVGMPDYITVARLGTKPYVRMEVLGCPIMQLSLTWERCRM